MDMFSPLSLILENGKGGDGSALTAKVLEINLTVLCSHCVCLRIDQRSIYIFP